MTDPAFTCPRCGRASHNPSDAEHRYCGACHAFVGTARSADVARMHIDDDVLWTARRVFDGPPQKTTVQRVAEAIQLHADEATRLTTRRVAAAEAYAAELLAERDEARRLARHLAIRLAALRRGDLQGPEPAMCKHAMGYPEEPDVNAPAPWIAGFGNGSYECLGCHRVTPHAHEHDTAHGIAETHMAGTERYRCTSCGRTTHAHDPGAERMRFVLDKGKSS